MSQVTSFDAWREKYPEMVAEVEAALDKYMVEYEKELDQALAAPPKKPAADE